MFLTAVIALKLTGDLPAVEQADWIGADAGALVLAQKHVHMKLAIGDFDSVKEEDLVLIREYAEEVIQLNPIKDDSDSEAALNEALKRGYRKVILIGALGGRIDHEYYNLRLVLKHPGTVVLLDSRNRIEALSPGTYPALRGEYKYISFFADQQAEISLKGFAYPLDHRIITSADLYTLSNEITEESASIEIHSGKVLMIQCRD